MNKEFLNLLGIAQRARKVVYGDEAFDAITNSKAKLVILSKEAGSNTNKKVEDKCNSYNVPICYTETTADLAHAVGKANIVLAVIIDEGFANALLKK